MAHEILDGEVAFRAWLARHLPVRLGLHDNHAGGTFGSMIEAIVDHLGEPAVRNAWSEDGMRRFEVRSDPVWAFYGYYTNSFTTSIYLRDEETAMGLALLLGQGEIDSAHGGLA